MFKVSGMVQQNKVAHRLGAQRRGRETGGSYFLPVLPLSFLNVLSIPASVLTQNQFPCPPPAERDMMLESMEQDLHNVRDDMVAFIEGHGMRRFNAYVNDDVASVIWPATEDHPDAWKDFVELAKASGVNFVTMNYVELDKEDADLLVDRLQEIDYMNEEDLEEARWLRNFAGKVGYIQLGFPCQGVMFLYELSTDWYENFERLENAADDYDGILIDDTDQEED